MSDKKNGVEELTEEMGAENDDFLLGELNATVRGIATNQVEHKRSFDQSYLDIREELRRINERLDAQGATVNAVESGLNTHQSQDDSQFRVQRWLIGGVATMGFALFTITMRGG